MNASQHQPEVDLAPVDELIHDNVGKLAFLTYKVEACKDEELRAGFIREMHRAATKLNLLLGFLCECDEVPGLAPGESLCELEAYKELYGFAKNAPIPDCPFERIAEEIRSQRGDASGKGGER